jgi:hypothetical protein
LTSSFVLQEYKNFTELFCAYFNRFSNLEFEFENLIFQKKSGASSTKKSILVLVVPKLVLVVPIGTGRALHPSEQLSTMTTSATT